MKILKFIAAIALAAVSFQSCKEDESSKKTREYNVSILGTTSRELASNYSATIRGKQDVDIRPKVSGYITDIYVKEGSTVKKGQTLFVIDQSQYESEMQTASANVNVAESAVAASQLTLDAKEQLFKEKIISSYELQMARTTLARDKATLAQAKANLDKARNNLGYTLVKSPSDGVVGSLPFRVGTLVSPSDKTPLTAVSDNSEMYVYFSMTENQVLSLMRHYGSLEDVLRSMPDVKLLLSDGSLYNHNGRVEAISGIIDQNTGALAVRAKFKNPERLLLSGGSGNVILPYEQSNCTVIPQYATYEVQDQIFAFQYSCGKVKSKIINVFPISNGKEYIVEKGLAPGDTIVVEGVGMLRDGASIKIKNVIENKDL